MSNANDVTYGEDWLRACGKTVSPAGARVANLVNWWLRGIYHAQADVLRADWAGEHVRISFGRWNGFSTFDFDGLTRLVVGAHDAAIRVAVEPCNPHYLRLTFHPRNRDQGHLWGRHPTMEAALERMPRLPRFADLEVPA